jgi:hypothetical protein
MLSDALREDRRAFDHIAKVPAYKVVILLVHHYFASGGTKGCSRSRPAGQITDSNVFNCRWTADCPSSPQCRATASVPAGPRHVRGHRAAQQESRHVSPHELRLPPGAGVGACRQNGPGSRESLFTAQPHTGAALKSRDSALRAPPGGRSRRRHWRTDRTSAAQALIQLKQQLTVCARLLDKRTGRTGHAARRSLDPNRCRGSSATYQKLPRCRSPRRAPESAKPRVGGDDSRRHRYARTLLANELMKESDIDENAHLSISASTRSAARAGSADQWHIRRRSKRRVYSHRF